jgi:23S rRNA (cytosine1962-C5)-methyltransferase
VDQVRVNRKAADRVASGHPWIFSSDVSDRGTAQPGAAVAVVDPRNKLLGTAHFSSTSQITLRMLSGGLEPVDRAFFHRRLSAALDFRTRHIRKTEAYRLVHGEGDLLPALVVDRYADFLVVQTLSQGMEQAQGTILECLTDLLHPTGVVLRNDVAVRKHEQLPLETRIAQGDVPAAVAVWMNGLRMEADLVAGQKTGIFLDQRENYVAAAAYAAGAALDCFTSTGGFALQMASRCERVEAVDSSGPALAIAARNAAANGISNIEFREADVFELLAGYVSGRRHYQTVVLDPPAFAKSRRNLEDAARGYKEINLRALRLLQPGGILVTCSCSHHMSEADFLGLIAEASLDAGRTLRVLERRTQSQDHPILLTVPETHYLKCIVLQVL